MNLIVVVLDTFRQDFVGHYHRGSSRFDHLAPCQTPNLDAFAEQSVVFTSAYPEALPTMPIRLQLMTGQRTLHVRPWGALGPGDLTIADILRAEGYVCGLITDNYHFRGPGMNFFRSYNAYRWIRGQEYDPYESAPPTRNLDDHVNEHYNELWRNLVRQCLANMNHVQSEDDYFVAQVVDEAIRWLRANRPHKNVFCWIDAFDPHEPWEPPPRWDTYGDPGYQGKRYILPLGGLADTWSSAEEQSEIRALYAGECAFVDHCLGRLFAFLQESGFYDDSAILLLADHGHPLADHGKFLKGADRLYNELLRVPFMLRLPGAGKRGRRDAIVQFQDVLPTLLELLGLEGVESAFAGRSFRAVVEGDADRHREAIIAGYHEGVDRVVRDARHSLILRPEGEPDELYDLVEDPREQRNLIDERHDAAVDLARRFGRPFFRRRLPQIHGVQGKYEILAGTA
ncbi:MAG TPA: sulfatase [Chloroflexota bacterium]|jgi:arylsulfatase A-like enzyme|nr:sulfatase [Chloroflexota bacterium]